MNTKKNRKTRKNNKKTKINNKNILSKSLVKKKTKRRKYNLDD